MDEDRIFGHEVVWGDKGFIIIINPSPFIWISMNTFFPSLLGNFTHWLPTKMCNKQIQWICGAANFRKLNAQFEPKLYKCMHTDDIVYPPIRYWINSRFLFQFSECSNGLVYDKVRFYMHNCWFRYRAVCLTYTLPFSLFLLPTYSFKIQHSPNDRQF